MRAARGPLHGLRINGRPVDSLTVRPDGIRWRSRLAVDDNFSARDEDRFQIPRQGLGDRGATAVFDFRFERANNFTLSAARYDRDCRDRFLRRSDRQLQRVESYASELDPNEILLPTTVCLNTERRQLPILEGFWLRLQAAWRSVSRADHAIEHSELSRLPKIRLGVADHSEPGAMKSHEAGRLEVGTKKDLVHRWLCRSLRRQDDRSGGAFHR